MNIRIACARGIATLSALAGALSLAACADFSQDGGFDAVARSAEPRIGQTAVWKRTPEDRAAAERDTKVLLDRPLSADDAVRIALLNNGSLQAAFAELGIAEADVVQSGRLPNPRFTVRRSSARGLNASRHFSKLSLALWLYAGNGAIRAAPPRHALLRKAPPRNVSPRNARRLVIRSLWFWVILSIP